MIQYFYRILHSLAWDLIPLPRRFEPAVRPHHRAQRRDNLGATFCQWLHFRRRVVWRSVDASPTWSPLRVGHAPRYIPLLLDNATSLRQFALLCRNHICATLFCRRVRGSTRCQSPLLTASRRAPTVPITSADSSAFDLTVSGTGPGYCEEGWVFWRIVGVLTHCWCFPTHCWGSVW